VTDALAGLGDGDTASAETPAAPPVDIETLKAQVKAELAADYDKRISGLQTALNRKDEEAKRAIEKARELERSGMSQDEIDAQEWQSLQDQNAALARKVQILELSGQYGDLVPLYQQMLEAPDVKTQLELLASLRKQQAQAEAPTQTPPPETEPDIPDIDPNNPSTPLPQGSFMANGQVMTDEAATSILSRLTRMPGR
jgi:hypothetical protein